MAFQSYSVFLLLSFTGITGVFVFSNCGYEYWGNFAPIFVFISIKNLK